VVWVFGYGSLMWDGGWEAGFGCTTREQATLAGFRRDFNKGSVRNWGSNDVPCPTLGLHPDDDAQCTGLAFEFPDKGRRQLLTWLSDREGRSFSLEPKEVQLQSRARVSALVPINDLSANTYLGDQPIAVRAGLVKTASGTRGSCLDYVINVRTELAKLGIVDSAVEQLWADVSRP